MHFSIIVIIIWLIFMTAGNHWHLFKTGYFMTITMIFGSFIAGASAEGGGAIAFPVMTLIYNITPDIARNFSLAIQSIGMTSASFYILKKKILVDYNYLCLSSISGFIGLILGTIYIIPLVPNTLIKMIFVSFWLSFAFVLFYLNNIKGRITIDRLHDLGPNEKILLSATGFCGGILTSLLGSGIDILTFSLVTLRYNLSEKVATPTSVIIMALNSIFGFLLHAIVIGDFGGAEFSYWILCIPVVVIGAPLGAYTISRFHRLNIAGLLYIIIVVQFIGAVLIIRPTGYILLFSIAVFIFGILFFSFFGKIISLPKIIPFNKKN